MRRLDINMDAATDASATPQVARYDEAANEASGELEVSTVTASSRSALGATSRGPIGVKSPTDGNGAPTMAYAEATAPHTMDTPMLMGLSGLILYAIIELL